MLLSGFLAGLLAFVVQAGIDTNFYSLRQATLFWTLAGLAVGYAIQAERQANTGPPRLEALKTSSCVS